MQDLRLVILAGGKARRMHGKNKGLITLNGFSLLELVIKRVGANFKPENIYLNLNHNTEDYAEIIDKLQLNQQIISDLAPNYQGPLAGILASLAYFKKTKQNVKYVLFCPCDSPFLPQDLAFKLYNAISVTNSDIALASSPNGWQNSCCLISLNCIKNLEKTLDNKQLRISSFIKSQKFISVDFANDDNFFNINDENDLAKAAQIYSKFTFSEKG